jgi:transcriptional regulator with XRE-family HTH domain
VASTPLAKVRSGTKSAFYQLFSRNPNSLCFRLSQFGTLCDTLPVSDVLAIMLSTHLRCRLEPGHTRRLRHEHPDAPALARYMYWTYYAPMREATLASTRPDLIHCPQLTIGQRVRMLRQTYGLTPSELATRADVPASTVSDLERDRQRSTGRLGSLARVLGVDAYWLETGRVDGPSPVRPLPIPRQHENPIGSRLHARRTQVSLTAAELGRLVEASESTVLDWEQGAKVPSAVDLMRLCAALGVGADVILWGAPSGADTRAAEAATEAARLLANWRDQAEGEMAALLRSVALAHSADLRKMAGLVEGT